jgi:23S rRNA pseudouridine955/2504/2580 synthase
MRSIAPRRFRRRVHHVSPGLRPRPVGGADAAASGGAIITPTVPNQARNTRGIKHLRRESDAPSIGGPPAAEAHAPKARQLVVDAGAAGQRLDNFLLRELKGAPKTLVYRVIRSGEVRVNRGRAEAATRLAEGDAVRVPPLRLPDPAGAPAASAPPREFAVLHEDEHLLAIDKPAGVAVHGGSGVAFGVIEQLRRARPEARFLELVHRLDKETSGVLLLAKRRSALLALQAQLRGRGTEKRYAAIVAGAWPAALKVIDLPLVKGHDAAGERYVRARPEGDAEARRSISIVNVQQRLPGHTLLEVQIRTGRTHQIRVHLAHHGHPIVGDPKYGDFAANRAFARESGVARMLLHARTFGCEHPAGGARLVLQAPLPAAFAAAAAASRAR